MWLQTLLLLGLVGLMLDVCYGYSSEDEDYYMQELLSREHYQRVSEDRTADGRQTPGRGIGKESRSTSAASKASNSASGNVNTCNWLRLILSSCSLACKHVRCHRVPSLNTDVFIQVTRYKLKHSSDLFSLITAVDLAVHSTSTHRTEAVWLEELVFQDLFQPSNVTGFQ